MDKLDIQMLERLRTKGKCSLVDFLIGVPVNIQADWTYAHLLDKGYMTRDYGFHSVTLNITEKGKSFLDNLKT